MSSRAIYKHCKTPAEASETLQNFLLTAGTGRPMAEHLCQGLRNSRLSAEIWFRLVLPTRLQESLKKNDVPVGTCCPYPTQSGPVGCSWQEGRIAGQGSSARGEFHGVGTRVILYLGKD